MYILNDIVYNGEPTPLLKICGIRPLKNQNLWVRFNNGDVRIFDFNPLLNTEAFKELNNQEIFNNVYIDYGIPVWKDGEIDIAPEKLYEDGVNDDISKYI